MYEETVVHVPLICYFLSLKIHYMSNKPKSNVDPWVNKIFNLFYCAILFSLKQVMLFNLTILPLTTIMPNFVEIGSVDVYKVLGCETVNEDSITTTKDGYTYRSEKLR